MAVVLILLVFLIVMGVATVLGLTVDTRDPEYSLGTVFERRAASDDESR
jgi:hypothetical protein